MAEAAVIQYRHILAPKFCQHFFDNHLVFLVKCTILRLAPKDTRTSAEYSHGAVMAETILNQPHRWEFLACFKKQYGAVKIFDRREQSCSLDIGNNLKTAAEELALYFACALQKFIAGVLLKLSCCVLVLNNPFKPLRRIGVTRLYFSDWLCIEPRFFTAFTV